MALVVETLHGPWPFPPTGNEKLDKLFAEAEKWSEIDCDERGPIEHRYFVRHPRYPKCIAMIRRTITNREGGSRAWVGTGEVSRTITDNQLTPANGIRQIARYTQRLRIVQQEQAGGRPAERDYDSFFEQWEESGFNPGVKKEVLEEYLTPIREQFTANFRKTHGGKPQKKLIREALYLPRRRFHQAMYRRKAEYK